MFYQGFIIGLIGILLSACSNNSTPTTIPQAQTAPVVTYPQNGQNGIPPVYQNPVSYQTNPNQNTSPYQNQVIVVQSQRNNCGGCVTPVYLPSPRVIRTRINIPRRRCEFVQTNPCYNRYSPRRNTYYKVCKPCEEDKLNQSNTQNNETPITSNTDTPRPRPLDNPPFTPIIPTVKVPNEIPAPVSPVVPVVINTPKENSLQYIEFEGDEAKEIYNRLNILPILKNHTFIKAGPSVICFKNETVPTSPSFVCRIAIDASSGNKYQFAEYTPQNCNPQPARAEIINIAYENNHDFPFKIKIKKDGDTVFEFNNKENDPNQKPGIAKPLFEIMKVTLGSNPATVRDSHRNLVPVEVTKNPYFRCFYNKESAESTYTCQIRISADQGEIIPLGDEIDQAEPVKVQVVGGVSGNNTVDPKNKPISAVSGSNSNGVPPQQQQENGQQKVKKKVITKAEKEKILKQQYSLRIANIKAYNLQHPSDKIPENMDYKTFINKDRRMKRRPKSQLIILKESDPGLYKNYIKIYPEDKI